MRTDFRTHAANTNAVQPGLQKTNKLQNFSRANINPVFLLTNPKWQQSKK